MAGPFPPPNQWNTFPTDIENIKSLVGKYFPIYEVRVTADTVSLFCNVDQRFLEKQFDDLRKEMRGQHYVPILVYERGEHIIHVIRTPPVRPMTVWVNVAFLIFTIITTILAGALAWYGYVGASGDIYTAEMLGMGCLTFALPLLVILGAHELSHYYAAKRHGVAASLPFFIPSWPPLGTFGAFISIREPIPNRKALLDIGAAGPIASFLLSIPITIAGLYLTAHGSGQSITNAGGSEYIGPSFFFSFLNAFIPIPGNQVIHPLAFAGWVGLFVTALNLLPAGQLDGGHIARALLGDNAKYASYGAIALMVGLGLLFYFGWLIFAALIFFLGIRHPPPLNDVTKLPDSRKFIGMGLAAVLLLCFVPIPMGQIAPENHFVYTNDVQAALDNGTEMSRVNMTAYASAQTGNVTYSFYVVNTGNTLLSIKLELDINTTMFSRLFNGGLYTNHTHNSSDPYNMELDLNSGESAQVTANITVPGGYIGVEKFKVTGQGKDEGGAIRVEKTLSFTLNVV